VALLLTIGAMNSYFAGASRLGAALAAEGALPRWLAQPGEARRSLGLVGGLALGMTLVMAVTGLSSGRLLLIATGTFSVAYLIATVAAIRILPAGWSRLMAVFSAVASVGLVIVTGWPVLVSVAVGLVAAFWPRRSNAEQVSVLMPTDAGSLALSTVDDLGDRS
jgi:amino acid efflux transporter